MSEVPAGQVSDDALDPAVATVLEQLWVASKEGSGQSWVLAKLAKRARLPMSTLLRTLTQLKSAGLVDFSVDESGRGVAELTGQGCALCETVAGIAAGGAA